MKKNKDCIMEIKIRANIDGPSIFADSLFRGPVTKDVARQMLVALTIKAGTIAKQVMALGEGE